MEISLIINYGRSDSPTSLRSSNTGLNTTFTTPGHLELNTNKMILTVRAYTRVGGGTPATHSVSTLSKPRERFAIRYSQLL